jgi:hypothetical protein
VFSAKGAISIPAWGDAPGIRLSDKQALKARLKPADVFLGTVNRAFSAGDFCDAIDPGALPQARYECYAFNASTLNASTTLILFALVVSRRCDAIVYGVGMKHYRDKVKEKETDPEPGRRDGGQKDENSHGNSSGHPQKTSEFMSFVNMSQTGNDA